MWRRERAADTAALPKIGTTADGQQLAGQRPPEPTVATSAARLHLSLPSDLQRVDDLDAKVSDGALSELK